jgi:DNA-binding NarL/FixJ family response regulator
MIKTEADLAKLTYRQREVLIALARRLSNDEVARLLHIAEATTNIDSEALLQAYATAQEVLSRPESSTTQSPALASLAGE